MVFQLIDHSLKTVLFQNKEGIQLECFNTSEVHNEWVSSVTDGVFNGVPSLLSSVSIKSTNEVHNELKSSVTDGVFNGVPSVE